jgi:hypothetical protein
VSDPVGTLGQSKPDPGMLDLSLAYTGGPGFADRLKQLGDARDAHDKAFAKLQLGNDAVAARTAAQAKLEEAERARAEAAATFEEAKKARADAETYAADTHAKAEKAHEEALANKAAADEKSADVTAAAERHRRAAHAADEAKAKADETKSAFEAKLKRLNELLAEFRRS